MLDETLNTAPMVFKGRLLGTSFIRGLIETQEVLDFCGEHNSTSDIKLIGMKDIHLTYERMHKSEG